MALGSSAVTYSGNGAMPPPGGKVDALQYFENPLITKVRQ